MNNTNKLKLNSVFGLIYQFVVLLSGLIIPRYTLIYFNSDINGLVSSINQFLAVITFLEMGIGAVVQSALYKPISKKDYTSINAVLSETQNFFKKLGWILVIYVFLLLFIFPSITNSPFDFYGTGFLIIVLSFRLFSEYLFGITLQLFLNANQLNYISYTSLIITVVFNTIISIVLMRLGFNIQMVKLFSGLVYVFRPLFLKIYVQKKFGFVDTGLKVSSSSIPQKWNGMANQISYTVTNSTDIVVLTIMSSLENVSVYAVHNLVINGLNMFVSSIVGGIQSFLGTLVAEGKITELKVYFSKIEWLMHTVVTFIFGLTAVLLSSFVLIYTNGVNDANYNVPIFAMTLTIAKAIYCIRLPYNELTKAVGHFKQTQNASIIEAIINVVLSVILVAKFGLIGVAIGTLVATVYRTLYLVNYLSENIVYKARIEFWKHIFVDFISFTFIYVVSLMINYQPLDFIHWAFYATGMGSIYAIFMLVINLIFYRNNIIRFIPKKFRL